MRLKNEYHHSNRYTINNFRSVRDWANEAGHHWERSALTESDPPTLRSLWGMAPFRFQASDHVADVWPVVFEGHRFWVAAAERWGCEISVEMPQGQVPWEGQHHALESTIVAFLEQLLAQLPAKVPPTSQPPRRTHR